MKTLQRMMKTWSWGGYGRMMGSLSRAVVWFVLEVVLEIEKVGAALVGRTLWLLGCSVVDAVRGGAPGDGSEAIWEVGAGSLDRVLCSLMMADRKLISSSSSG